MNNQRLLFLMCRPTHFGVLYAINPWMNPLDWQRHETVLAEQAQRQWADLRGALLARGATIELVPAVERLPDLVFAANAAVVLDGKALLARFRHPERQAEEPHFRAMFHALKARGVVHAVQDMPDGMVLEGAGDCVFDHTRNLFWMGFGPRSHAAARRLVGDTFGVEAVALELVDPRFYHMDTALCPLPGGEVLYVPGAFTAAGRATIAERVGKDWRIEIGEGDAGKLAANAVCLDGTLVMSACSERLRAELAERGYRVAIVPLGAFLRSGGSAFCLTLRLDRRSGASAQPELRCQSSGTASASSR
ncbi:dimethylarginine dimethylaminohydrolase family protein [Rhodoplanes sp. Z2-YC6860]|uniref:dimethylarginine dimethylaminohydrolase family protein n=1 Tax=Rhodoplanes sp. Z2-YC6860 TaxID=674703 RepID=UPI00078E736C|nr:arginine deiminase-related protein [Rhodoplanes sp. Z2-YC6860]AMN42567.1 amidinotransferase [Rhodoplanes sp. Z2-YC6860]